MFLYIVCFLSFKEAFSPNVDTVANDIAEKKVAYCNSISKTNEQERKKEFYGHIAEQHLGLGVDSYARYSGNPPGGDMKLLRSEFVLVQFEDYRIIVRQGALCLWCREVLDANIKPVYVDINNLITPVRKILDGIERADPTKQAAIITKVKKKIAAINVAANKINKLSVAITSKLAIIEKLLSATDKFRDENGSDTRVVMNSVPVNLRSMLENLDKYTQICKDIAEANTADRLDLTTLQNLKKIDLSYIESVLKLLENHILYVRSIFTNINETAIGVAKGLFENILDSGTLLKNGPHIDSSINLLYQYDIPNVTMKAELNARDQSSSWYNGGELVDNRPVVKQIRLGFQFDGKNLFYGTMFPERY